jgi:signal transduction histidine kinase
VVANDKGKRLSLRAKVVGLTAILITVIVATLTLYFPSHEIATLEAAQDARLNGYGELLANQAQSAVAFADRETAREVLIGLAADPDVVSTTLLVDGGPVLYQRGSASGWVASARHGVSKRRVVRQGDRVAVVTPVVSLEGPRGTLVIELSTEDVDARQRTVIWAAIALGLAALAFGVIFAELIARSLTRRLRAIDDVATAVAAGSTEVREVVVDGRDEIGSLALAFNSMLAQLRSDQQRLQATVRELRTADEALALNNRELERRVEVRTADLQRANGQLKAEMEHRMQIELELQQAQKLESVGRLAAGIAHEINTPIQFASDSCAFLESATADLVGVLRLRRELVQQVQADELTVPEAIECARQAEEDAEVDFLLGEMPLAVQRARHGLERVAAIVQAMKEFAYADQSEQAPSDINRAIETTLTIAHNEYKYLADVRTELAELPLVTCHLGELNQVILNLVINAAHAIADVVGDSGRRGSIVVRTRHLGDSVAIEIEDDGCGIPNSLVDKIFDPFFTTKPIGKGSGQGLAIARSVIVDKHEGRLSVRSSLGVGTVFQIHLPVRGAGSQQTLSLAS